MSRLSRYLVVMAAIGLVAALALSCGESKPTPPPGLSETQMVGWQAYVSLNCGSCHGDDREGKRSGPVLAELDTHWTPDELVRYLGDPPAMIKTIPRLAYKAENYPIAMPAYADKADAAALQALADYLLVDPS